MSARLPVSSISRSSPTRASISAHSAPVRWSFQRIAGPQHLAVLAEHDEPVHLAREADRPVGQPRAHGLGGAPPVLGILLGPARAAASRAGSASSALASTSPSGVDRDALDAGRADVDADERVTSLDLRELDQVPERVAAGEARPADERRRVARLDARLPRAAAAAPSRSSTTRQKCGLSARRLVDEHQMQLEVAADAVPDEPGRVELRQHVALLEPEQPAVERARPLRPVRRDRDRDVLQPHCVPRLRAERGVDELVRAHRVLRLLRLAQRRRRRSSPRPRR